jgi:LmbE family N-acetylglucosaminyl deacetylase
MFTASYRAHHAAAVAARDEAARRSGAAGDVDDVAVSDWARRGAVVVAPHPDDEVIGCGGTLLDIVAAAGSVTVIQVTDGSDSAAFIDESEEVRRRVRLDEARDVAGTLGAGIECLGADNRALRATAELAGRMRDVLERSRAGIAFAPSFTDIHPDHQTVLRVLAEAMRAMSGPRPDVALYEVWSLVTPTHVHDVGARIGEIEALLLRYETALKIDDYVRLVAERLLFNSYTYRDRPGYLEAFTVMSGDRFCEAAERQFSAAGRA